MIATVVIAIAHKHTFRVKEKSILASRAVFANHLPRIRILNGNNGSSGRVCGRGEEGVCHHFIFLLISSVLLPFAIHACFHLVGVV